MNDLWMLQRFFCSYVFSKFVTMNFVHLGPAWVSLTLLASWFLSSRHKIAFLHKLFYCLAWHVIDDFAFTLFHYHTFCILIMVQFHSIFNLQSCYLGVNWCETTVLGIAIWDEATVWFGHRWFDVTMCRHILSHSSCLDLIFAANSERFESG